MKENEQKNEEIKNAKYNQDINERDKNILKLSILIS